MFKIFLIENETKTPVDRAGYVQKSAAEVVACTYRKFTGKHYVVLLTNSLGQPVEAA